MEKGLVSVVLPIYGVEKYLDRCVESVIHQTYTNLEIILVDDGSPDSCPQKCDDWAGRDSRIKVVHKKNAGLGMARNTGIENATGEYICFFDSDDYIALDAVEKAYRCASANQAELVLFGFCNVGADGTIRKKTVPCTPHSCYEGEQVTQYVLPNLLAPDPKTGVETNLWMSAWACFYSMELIQRVGWRFVSEREYISEDLYSLLCLYWAVKKVAILPETLYFYCDNGGSLTHVYRKDRYEKNQYCYDACLSVCDKLGYSEDVKNRLAFQYISNIIGAMKLIVTSDDTEKNRRQLLKDVVVDAHLQSVLHQMDIRKEKTARRILLEAMRKKLSFVVYELVRLKS